mmetsp:Transcript_27088/g.78583  ORF Transcript_27088/g.78583 Transcript_27088/m.78583 type:complete len:891 (-) Transcript_27088:44-2716(-)
MMWDAGKRFCQSLRCRQCRCTSTNMIEDERASRISLRFKDPGLEWGYRLTLRDRAVTNFCYANCVLFIMEAAFLSTLKWERSFFKSQAHFEVEQGTKMANALLACTGLSVAALALVQRRWKLVSPLAVEIIVTWFTMLQMVTCLFTEAWWMAKIKGYDPTQVMTYHFTDSWLVLAIDTVVTLGHFLYSVRWVNLWPLTFLGAMLYPIACMALGSPEKNPYVNWLTLAGLALFAAHGKRTREIQERRAFVLVLKERTLRVQTEFKMHTLEEERATSSHLGARPRTEHDTKSTSSVSSGYLFAGVDPSNLPTRLRELSAKGHQEGWLIPTENMMLAPTQVLGKGSFGMAVIGKFHGSPVAVKLSLRSADSGQAGYLADLTNELRVLRHVRHPSIAIFHGAVIDPQTCDLALVLELVRGPGLDRYIKESCSIEGGTASPRDLLMLMLDISRALRYLHQQRPPIMHGDLKPANVVIQRGASCVYAKLLDFGLSRVLSKKTAPLGGSLPWVAPEVLQQRQDKRPNASADMFSFGRVVHFCATGTNPWSHVARDTIIRMLRQGAMLPPWWPQSPTPFVGFCKDLSEACTAIEPSARPGAEAACLELESWARSAPLSELLGSAGAMPTAGHLVSRQEDFEDFATLHEFKPWQEAIRAVRGILPLRGPAERALVSARVAAQRVAGGRASQAVATPPDDATRVAEAPQDAKDAADPPDGTRTPPSQRPTASESSAGLPASGPSPALARTESWTPTPSRTRLAMLFKMVQQWYCDQHELEAYCCPFHCAMTAVSNLSTAARRTPCHTVSIQYHAGQRQCTHCFALETARSSVGASACCMICGHRFDDCDSIAEEGDDGDECDESGGGGNGGARAETPEGIVADSNGGGLPPEVERNVVKL